MTNDALKQSQGNDVKILILNG